MTKRVFGITVPVTALLILPGCGKAPATPAVAASAGTNTYASLGALPDWSGAAPGLAIPSRTIACAASKTKTIARH
jgi:hypothetical protein